MIDIAELPRHRLLTLPESAAGVLSIRAKALLFHDPRSVELLDQVERVARSDASVLLIGETGTGKELIARHIHTKSARKGPFVAVNCGAFSESLIDAELFGHEAGAFTGAAHARAGWFEAAQGGTLFLDEIGDLPLAQQVKLLRVLQERQVVRLGSRKTISLDVRLVAATNIDLRQAVEAQHFRADLYYRLGVATIALPPLRERRGDILPLVGHFVGVYAPRLSLHDVTLDGAAERALLEYPWPGNIRELENVVHFALIVCRHGVVRAGDLKLVGALARDVAAAPVGSPSVDETTELDRTASAQHDLSTALARLLEEQHPALLHDVESALVHAAYAHARENQVRAALALGVTRNTLRTLLKRHGLLAESPAARKRDLPRQLPNVPFTAHC